MGGYEDDADMEPEAVTLGHALPLEMTRVRGLVAIYETIPTGRLAAALMNATLDAAQRALAEGDVAAMLRAYESLKGFEA
jgi:hypothetical protein